ncbi:MAG: Thiosulfate sulfurtransferase GlpE [Alphaproteobacteria bacterium MarineAlpha11_Bin1]|nr:MAG: Thiosulfate sulfurtransferase GlpE [Alphaproteobacteria bacterium MarineAlpha11_Bin1]|tara:strand:- start:5748 stop:7334 length:1587 start_codon:yes stop_codon:yes gene_type:complete
MEKLIDAKTLKSWINDAEEIALLDVREAGQFGADHMLHSIPCPYSILETRVPILAPRRSVRVALVDADDGTAQKAARRLAGIGYKNISILRGGNAAWAAAGFEVFQGVNVPSKAFGEVVEYVTKTPNIPAEELKEMMEAGENMVIVDGRTPMEHHNMSIPGGVSMPNAEMIYRIHDLAPDPDTTIVVNCAGRTRSIIGAQALINAGLPNRIVALKAGTMGWGLAGFQLDHGSSLSYAGKPSLDGARKAAAYADYIIERFHISTVNRETLSEWKGDETRTLFLLDIRAEGEYIDGHLPGSVNAPGGQLVQATDQWCGVWKARVVLIDTAPCSRAAITAHWLKQMGWDVYILESGLDSSEATEQGTIPQIDRGMMDLNTLTPLELSNAITSGSAFVVDVDNSMDYREGHLPGAVWCTRSRIERLKVPDGVTVVLYSEHETRARLAAIDLSEEVGGPIAILEGGRDAWNAGSFPIEASPEIPMDADCIDYLFWVSRRHMGSDEAALAYLEWEENLPAQIEADGDARFSVMT